MCKNSCWKLLLPVFLLGMTALLEAARAGDPPAGPRPLKGALGEVGGFGDPRGLGDPGFRPYVEQQLLLEALAEGNARQLADVALQLAFGEKVLLRPHAQLPAAKLLPVVVRLAAETRDVATLQRLERAAHLYDLADLKPGISAALTLAKAPRRVGPAVNLEQITPEGVVLYRSFLSQIQVAKAIGDRQELEGLRDSIASVTVIPGEQRAALIRMATEAAAAQAEGSSDTDDVLRRLVGASRSLQNPGAQAGAAHFRAERSMLQAKVNLLESQLRAPQLAPEQRTQLEAQLVRLQTRMNQISLEFARQSSPAPR